MAKLDVKMRERVNNVSFEVTVSIPMGQNMRADQAIAKILTAVENKLDREK